MQESVKLCRILVLENGIIMLCIKMHRENNVVMCIYFIVYISGVEYIYIIQCVRTIQIGERRADICISIYLEFFKLKKKQFI